MSRTLYIQLSDNITPTMSFDHDLITTANISLGFKDLFLIFLINFNGLASELIENHEKMFLRYYIILRIIIYMVGLNNKYNYIMSRVSDGVPLDEMCSTYFDKHVNKI